jgi:Methyltransferase domain
VTPSEIEAALRRLWLDGFALRKEDLKKTRELSAMLPELGRARGGLLVDAAAGHGYLGLLAVELLGIPRVVLLERDPTRAERCREAAARLTRPAEIEVRTGEVGERALWPDRPAVVAALHACGPAADQILEGAIASRARWILVVPCCYSSALAFAPGAEAHAESLGLPRQSEVRRRFVESLIDGERALRLEAAGYEVQVAAFVPPTVTPHNRLFRARRAGEPRRMEEAAERLRRLRLQ